MTSWAHTSYLVRYLKQFDYIKQTRNGKIHRHSKSLFISNELHSVTRRGVLDYISKSTQYKQFPQKKKKKKGDKGERQKEECDREKRKEEKKMGTEEKGRKKEEEADEKAVEEERREKKKRGEER